MLLWSAVFFAVAVVAGIFGFTGIAAASAGVAQFLFALFALLAVGAFLLHQVPFDRSPQERHDGKRDERVR